MGKLLKTFSSGQVLKMTGISYSVLDYWVKTGFIVPTRQVGSGKGSDRLFSFGDVLAIKAALRLRKLGASLQGLRQVVKHIQKAHNRPESTSASDTLRGRYLVWDGCEILEKTGNEVIVMLKRQRQYAFEWMISLEEASSGREILKRPPGEARRTADESRPVKKSPKSA